MFDKLDSFNQSEINALNFETIFINHLQGRHITSTKISGKHTISRKHSREVILKSFVIKEISTVEKKYQQNNVAFFNEKFDKYYQLPTSFNSDITQSLREGYEYFYKYFINNYTNVDFSSKCLICDRENIPFHWDHIIPKSKYPLFSLIPINLIQICNICNDNKLANFDFHELLPFHPLFEDLDVSSSIEVKIDFEQLSKGLGLGLFVNFKTSRLSNLIKLYKLQDLINDRVKREIKGFMIRFLKVHDQAGLDRLLSVYDPYNVKVNASPIDIATDRFITNLSLVEMENFKLDEVKGYFRLN